MKTCFPILVVFFIAWVAFIMAPLGFSAPAKTTNIYENMVNASVMIYDKSGDGSGVFIDDDVILTAAHVLEHPGLTIELVNGTVLEANDFYIDDKEDVGFIFVEANEVSIAKISSLPVSIGNTVFLVGRPFDDIFKFSLTKGIISHLDRDFPNMDWKDLLQTDVTGGPGSSGGPLYNSDGDLVGMYVGHTDGGGQGISLCEDAKSILEAYQRYKDAQN